MILGIKPEYIEIIELERIPPEGQRAGDKRVSITIVLRDFVGNSDQVWLAKEDIDQFIADIEKLEKDRKGEIILKSMSPDEFQLKLIIKNPTDAIRVEVTLSRIRFIKQSPNIIKLSGGFSLNQEYLLSIINDFKTFRSKALVDSELWR
jgi:hypothetical protein